MRKVMVFFLSMVMSFVFAANGFSEATEGVETAVSSTDEVQLLKSQLKELMQRIEQLEQNQAKGEEDLAKHKEDLSKKFDSAKVDLSNTLSKLKIKGRAAVGFYDSGTNGSHPSGAFQMPDAKIQFAFQPDDINTIVMRFNLNNATAQTPLLDYFFLQSKDFLPFLKNTPYSLTGRLGRFKLPFGEETQSNNPVEGMLPSNSAANTGVTDEGLELAGKIKLDKLKIANYTFTPLGWAVSVSNGNSGVGTDTSSGKAFMGKLNYSPINPLYLSVSYYNAGDLKRSDSEFSIAGLVSPPVTGATTATNWRREVWEVDGRYDFGKGKKQLDPPAYSDSKAILRLSYGGFEDSTSTAGTRERSGNFGFVDGLYNLNKKIYFAGRYSFINLDSDVTATLNSIASLNSYNRYSLGMGYRWSENTIVKLSYDWNQGKGPNVIGDANDNLLSALVTAQF